MKTTSSATEILKRRYGITDKEITEARLDEREGETMRQLQTVDLSGVIEHEDIPCCPLCGNEIEESEPIAIVLCKGSIALAHGPCVHDKMKE